MRHELELIFAFLSKLDTHRFHRLLFTLGLCNSLLRLNNATGYFSTFQNKGQRHHTRQRYWNRVRDGFGVHADWNGYVDGYWDGNRHIADFLLRLFLLLFRLFSGTINIRFNGLRILKQKGGNENGEQASPNVYSLLPVCVPS